PFLERSLDVRALKVLDVVAAAARGRGLGGGVVEKRRVFPLVRHARRGIAERPEQRAVRREQEGVVVSAVHLLRGVAEVAGDAPLFAGTVRTAPASRDNPRT